MSADLFAEFGFGAPANQSSRTALQQGARPSGGTSLIPDLETFGNVTYLSDGSTSQSIQPRAFPPQLNAPRKSSVSHASQYNNNSNVLFDATLENPPDDESEDWGEFESADIPPSQGTPASLIQKSPGAALDPIKGTSNELKKVTATSNQLDLFDSLSIKDESPHSHSQVFSALVDNTSTYKNSPKITSAASGISEEDQSFDEWGDFVDGPPTELPKSLTSQGPTPGKKPPQNGKAVTKLEERNISPSFGISGDPVSPAQIRPTNIPPPSVLLELFPQLFEQLRKEATDARKNIQEKQVVESVAVLIFFTLKAAARVVAGRTLRWKRDSILSQSMRIGPARSGKSGGMKLSTVNKNEDIKEQQEAVDVISLWRDRTALFNSVIQASGRRPIPVIPANIRAMTATAKQGALKASHACALCGLKREERLPKVDDHVEDSFGEWWTDHWGHTDCRQFWESNMSLLNQR
ncbi:hypothetical protein BBP40_005757 [Aspergillus hancockii]|nr:hypothetical protein BBP40_005757 [Aspergillus hancockii]